MTMNIHTARWDSAGYYDIGFGCGYYIDGFLRNYTSDGTFVEKPVKTSKLVERLERQTRFMAKKTSESEAGENGAPFVFFDDCSPVKVPWERIAEWCDPHPFAYVEFPWNLGCGGKENVLQYLLSRRCSFVGRWDADIELYNLDVDSILLAFETMPDAFVITSCITYFARLEASSKPERRYFSGSNFADFAVYRTAHLREIGFSDHVCRRNNDGDIRLRAKAQLGALVYSDATIDGKAPPSGSGNTAAARDAVGKYIAATRPFIQVTFPEGGAFRLTLDKKRADEAKGFWVGPHKFGIDAAQRLWR